MNTTAFLIGIIVSLGYYFYSVRQGRKNDKEDLTSDRVKTPSEG